MATVEGMQVNLFCDDVEACVAFYIALGLPEAFRTPRQGAPTHVEVDAGGTRIGLTSAAVANGIAGLGVEVTAAVTTEVALWCDDCDALFARALEAGAQPVTDPIDSPDGRLRFAWVRDPEGHQVKFVQPC